MELLRTPDEAFVGLSGWDHDSHLADVGGLHMAYVDAGPADAAPVLLLHGEPSWSYLYRHMIPPLVAAGHRVIAPDLIGFGRSDKPADRAEHTYAAHVGWLAALVTDTLDLRDITLFGQDWGGLIGLRMAAEHLDRFAAILASNTGLPTGDHEMSEAFMAWQKHSQTVPTFPVGQFLQGGTTRTLTPEEVAAYDAPFPDERYKEGPRQMPSLVPVTPQDPASAANRAAWESLSTFTRPFLTIFSDNDPITRGADKPFQKLVPGAAGQPHRIISGGHFVQEDSPAELAAAIDELARGAS